MNMSCIHNGCHKLCWLAAVAALHLSAWAESIIVVGDAVSVNGVVWSYSVKDNCATVTSASFDSEAPTPDTLAGKMIVPQTLGGHPVVAIGQDACRNNKDLKHLIIPNGVTNIGIRAFYDCGSLRSVAMPPSVKTIDATSFSDCPLEDITVPGDACPGGCFYAARDCTTNVTFVAGSTKVPACVFWYFTALQSVSIPEGVTTVCEQAFNGCTSLKNVTLPSTVREIGAYAFNGCTSLGNLAFPQGLSSIAYSAFASCYALTDVTLLDGVTNVEGYAFGYCKALKRLQLPPSVKAFEATAFDECPIEDLTVLGDACASGCFYHARGCTTNVTFVAGSTKVPSWALHSFSALQSVSIPEGVTTVCDQAFYGCTSLKNVTLPSTAREIGAYAFNGCTSLERMTIPQGVTGIAYSAFSSCYALTTVTLLDGMADIGEFAFANCTSLKSVLLPPSVEAIETTSFSGCGASLALVFLGDAPAGAGSAAYYANKVFYVPEYAASYETIVSSQKFAGYVTASDCPQPDNDFWAMYPGVLESAGGNAEIAKRIQPTCKNGQRKQTASGEPTYAWQDYVAGTDPTDPDSHFRATITMDNGVPHVQEWPKLAADEASKREYKMFGKKTLQDGWTEMNPGEEPNYRFFNIKVKMR